MAATSITLNIIELFLNLWVIEEDRKAQYLWDELRDEIQLTRKNTRRTFLSGSQAEGMRNAGDKDLMMITNEYIVVETVNQIPDGCKQGVLILDTERCHPGFAKLLLNRFYERKEPDESIINDEVNKMLFDDINGSLYLNRLKYVDYTYTVDMDGEYDPRHGPALLRLDKGINTIGVDLVACIEVPNWPYSAKQMLDRIKDTDLKNHLCEIVLKGCHIVAVSHTESKQPDHEFRLSFSYAEKLLIRTWSNQQMKLYLIVKDLFNRYFKEDNQEIEKGLCSYFAKTIIFWMIEEHPEPEYWDSQSIMELIEKFLAILKKYLQHKSCPNYFMPENFMMSHYTNDQVKVLLEKLDHVKSNLTSCLLDSDIIKEQTSTTWEMLVSLYNLTQAIEVDAVTEDILNGILNFYSNALPDRAKVLQLRYIQHLTDFMAFCQTEPWANGKPVEILFKVMENYDQYTERYDKDLCSYFFTCMARCSVHHGLHAAAEMNIEDKVGVYEDCEKYLLNTIENKGILNDCKLTGNVYLGIFYKTSGFLTKAITYFNSAIESYNELTRQDTRYWLVSLPIMMTSYGVVPPQFLVKHVEILLDVFLKRHLHHVTFDPLVLAVYLKYQITNNRNDLQLFDDLEAISEILKPKILPIPSGIDYETRLESYQYMKYRLGLYDKDSALHQHYENTTSIYCMSCNRPEPRGVDEFTHKSNE